MTYLLSRSLHTSPRRLPLAKFTILALIASSPQVDLSACISDSLNSNFRDWVRLGLGRSHTTGSIPSFQSTLMAVAEATYLGPAVKNGACTANVVVPGTEISDSTNPLKTGQAEHQDTNAFPAVLVRACSNDIRHYTLPAYPQPCSGTTPDTPAAAFADRPLPSPKGCQSPYSNKT